jgi:hypothetical protein
MATTERAMSGGTINWVTRTEVIKLLAVGSDGQLTMVEDDHRTLLVRPHDSADVLVLRLETTTMLLEKDGEPTIEVEVKLTDDLKPQRRLYCLFGYFSPNLMRFASPVFLVPSMTLRDEGRVGRRSGGSFRFKAQLSFSDPKWATYAEDPLELGQRVLEVLAKLKTPTATGRAEETGSDSK